MKPIGLEQPILSVKLCLLSGQLKEQKVLSDRLIAPAGKGKNFARDIFRDNKEIIEIGTMATRYGLMKKVLLEIAIVHHQNNFNMTNGEIINTDDLPFTHGFAGDSSNLIRDKGKQMTDLGTAINEITEEGCPSMDTYNFRLSFRPKLQLGMITTQTLPDYYDKWFEMSKSGTDRRSLNFKYCIPDKMQESIEYEIAHLKDFQLPKVDLDHHYAPHSQIIELPDKFADDLQLIVQRMKNRWWVDPDSTIRDLRILSKASALDRGKDTVDEIDMFRIRSLIPYFTSPPNQANVLSPDILLPEYQNELMIKLFETQFKNEDFIETPKPQKKKRKSKKDRLLELVSNKPPITMTPSEE